MLNEGLENLIENAPAVTAILGTPATRGDEKTTGVFPAFIPKGSSFPAIVYTFVHTEGSMTMDGPDPFHRARVQFSCYATKYDVAKRLARTLAQTLEAFTGVLSDGTEVDNMQQIGELDMFQEGPFIFGTHIEFDIAYSDISP